MSGLRRVYLLNQKCPWKYYICTSKRQLYSSTSLGIDSFVSQRISVLNSIPNLNVYKEKLNHICYTNSESLVFLEDVRKMVGVAETDEDLKLLFDLLRKYCKQNDLLFHNYHFGPEVMRLLYILKKPDEALMLMKDDYLSRHFKHFTTFLLFLDMMFENKMYKEVLEFYKKSVHTNKSHYKGNNILLIVLAACYKLNTLESFELACSAYKNSIKGHVKPSLKNCIMFTALAIKQNEPTYAVETFFNRNLNALALNYRVMAYAQAQRFDYALLSIKEALSMSSSVNFFITNEALSFVENEIQNNEIILEFQKLKEQLAAENLILDEPLDKFLFEKVDITGKEVPVQIKVRRY